MLYSGQKLDRGNKTLLRRSLKETERDIVRSLDAFAGVIHIAQKILRLSFSSVRQFDNYVGMLLGRPPESCGMSGACASYFTVEGDGSVYPCDFYVLDEWKMGNVREDSIEAMASSEAARRFVDVSRPINEKCAACRWLSLCRGGCRRNREPVSENALNQFCPAYQAFFEYAYEGLRRIAAAVAARRPR